MTEFIVVGFSLGTEDHQLPEVLVRRADDPLFQIRPLRFGEYALRWERDLLEWVVD